MKFIKLRDFKNTVHPYSKREGFDLAGLTVKLKQEWFGEGEEALRSEDHLFRVESGFGRSSFLRGTACFGEFLSDGERGRIERYDIESVLIEQEEGE